jgi:hypothetical protein
MENWQHAFVSLFQCFHHSVEAALAALQEMPRSFAKAKASLSFTKAFNIQCPMLLQSMGQSIWRGFLVLEHLMYHTIGSHVMKKAKT